MKRQRSRFFDIEQDIFDICYFNSSDEELLQIKYVSGNHF